MNRLKNADSPYLLQHANNPVDWFPWTEEAFDKAKRENKPVLVSIGYAACHWCHVMEKESFEDEGTAAYMNEHFINIKVDREEHPDVDHFYMDALQSMTGSGGWPLNMFVTPDKKPFYGGTYFPPKRMYQRLSWKELLETIQEMWKKEPDRIELQAEQMIKHLEQASEMEGAGEKASPYNQESKDAIIKEVLKYADNEYGGFGLPPKFFSAATIQLLLEYYTFEKRKGHSLSVLANQALNHALLSLDRMLEGGIYDQIGGGFSRYATDKKWLIPHFEKMLYDNALLISLYSDAYAITQKIAYKDVIRDTIEFCQRELRDSEGFFAALDADSEGEEGKYYIWTYAQIKDVIPDLHPAISDYFDISENGNWEGRIILNKKIKKEELIKSYGLTNSEFEKLVTDFKSRLFQKRQDRIRPATDDKILLSWNALMNIALCKAGIALANEEYIKEAEIHLVWLLNSFKKEDKGLNHVFKNGKSYIDGKLDDYSYLIKAIICFSSSSGNNKYFKEAFHLMEYVQENFTHKNHHLFYFSSEKQTDILVRKVEIYDGAVPSANSYMVSNLRDLGIYSNRLDWVEQSEKILEAMSDQAFRFPLSFSSWAILFQRKVQGLKQLIISGNNAEEGLKTWNKNFFPEIFSVVKDEQIKEGLLLISPENSNGYEFHLCTLNTCLPPVNKVEDLILKIKKMR